MSFRANESLAEQIAQHLGEQIISGDLVEGERIQEMRIVAELEVSRGSVREALLILQRRHLVAIYPRRGAVVAELSPQMVKSLYEMAVVLFGLAVRQTAENWRQNQLEPMLEDLSTVQEAVDAQDAEAYYLACFELLQKAQAFAANPYLDNTLADLQPSLRRAYFLALQLSRREMEESFGLIKGCVDAIMLRQGERAAELVEEFALHQRNLIIESLLRVKQIEMAWARRNRR